MKNILIIDDDINICSLLQKYLSRKGFATEATNTSKKALDLLMKQCYDLILCDFHFPDENGKEFMQKIKSICPEAKVVIMSGYSDVKSTIELIKSGAVDYITKPILPDELQEVISKLLSPESELELTKTGVVKRSVSSGITKFSDFLGKNVVGSSKQSKELQRQIELVAPTNYSVILYGESGTGKESVAHGIHELSSRANKPFVAVDCGALTRELAASELFGHEKGAFTGALHTKAGHFEHANGGTIFLDEITNLSYDIQVSLLRVIQERKVKRLGSSKDTTIDVRIIVASNERLTEVCNSGKFREDLYYRFNEFSINLPPLRERKEDIMLFADFFLRKTNGELDKKVRGFSGEVKEIFTNYRWPGNLREMSNVIKRAALLTTCELIKPESLPQELVFDIKFSQLDEGHHLGKQTQTEKTSNLKSVVQTAEYEMIMDVLKKFKFNKTKAAEYLNIDRKTLYNKMKAFSILQG